MVGRLVQDQGVALDPVAGGGHGAEQDGFFAQKGGAGVFHAAECEAGNQYQVVLTERERVMEILGHMANARRA